MSGRKQITGCILIAMLVPLLGQNLRVAFKVRKVRKVRPVFLGRKGLLAIRNLPYQVRQERMVRMAFPAGT